MPNTDIIPETYVSVNASTGFSWLKIATTTQAIGANIIVLTFLKVRNKIIQKNEIMECLLEAIPLF